MSRLIDADELLLNNTWLWFDENGNHTIAGEAIEDAPTVDAVKHGHWRDSRDTGVLFMECSVCKARAKKYAYLGAVGTNGIRYCPYCGAKMDEVET